MHAVPLGLVWGHRGSSRSGEHNVLLALVTTVHSIDNCVVLGESVGFLHVCRGVCVPRSSSYGLGLAVVLDRVWCAHSQLWVPAA